MLATLGVIAVVAELLVLRPLTVEREGPLNWLSVAFGLVGGSFVACGLIAWRRRPDSQSGMLMTATGFLLFVSPLLGRIDAELVNTVRILTVDWWTFPFVALILTLLTSGRLQRGVDRLLVASYALPLVLGQLLWMTFDSTQGAERDPDYQGDHLLLAFPDADVAHAIYIGQRVVFACVSVSVVAVVAVRWWRASPPLRRASLPSVGGAFGLLCLTTVLVNDLVAGTRSQVLLWIAVCSLLAVPIAFLTALLRSRLARGGLAELFRGLGTTQDSDLEAALRRALGDPSLALVVGREPEPEPRRAVARVGSVAAFVYDASLEDDPELVEAARAATAVAFENRRLLAEADTQLAELKASRERIVAAGDAERRRLERNLHDGAQQRLVALSFQLRLLENRVSGDGTAEELISTASDELRASLAELRELARGIHPAVLAHGLATALDSLASRSPVPTSVSCDLPERLPEQIELAAYFVASEALANVAKYSNATRASVRVWRRDGHASIEIVDDGVGGADETRGSGLRGLVDRVEALDGSLQVASPPGHGTTVTAQLPFVLDETQLISRRE